MNKLTRSSMKGNKIKLKYDDQQFQFNYTNTDVYM